MKCGDFGEDLMDVQYLVELWFQEVIQLTKYKIWCFWLRLNGHTAPCRIVISGDYPTETESPAAAEFSLPRPEA